MKSAGSSSTGVVEKDAAEGTGSYVYIYIYIYI